MEIVLSVSRLGTAKGFGGAGLLGSETGHEPGAGRLQGCREA